MKIVNLETLEGVPSDIDKRICDLENYFLKYEVFEEYENISEVLNLNNDINKFCNDKFIVGFHYSNTIPEKIISLGLISRNGEEIRKTFIDEYSHIFTSDEIKIINRNWELYYDEFQSNVRNKKIYFNFTLNSLYNKESDKLLKYYGGEQIFMGLLNEPHLLEKLTSIGQPLIIEVLLKTNEIKTIRKSPWGRILISTYHKRFNRNNNNILREDQDGYTLHKIKPTRIHKINYL
ncbi:hypothetical protein F0358_10530 [Empedobacter brevis]|uniref:hypothetical protein n=1 Tax=Empedobacter brevis TaxID=247 RepID=UPI00123DBC28|nr:hypothetical protein [Empedobacter brevis]QES93110.1 hypothetical protein F0358_10530 [Empedobacter brevis]